MDSQSRGSYLYPSSEAQVSSGWKKIMVCGEEEYVLIHLTSFQYMEVEGEVHENSFQAFEIVQTFNIPPPERKKKLETSLTSLKDAQALVEVGHSEGWGKVMDVIPKFNNFGLGFNPRK